MNCKRSAVGAVALGDHLYVCGGFDGISRLDQNKLVFRLLRGSLKGLKAGVIAVNIKEFLVILALVKHGRLNDMT